jgi:hypothetical protein
MRKSRKGHEEFEKGKGGNIVLAILNFFYFYYSFIDGTRI